MNLEHKIPVILILTLIGSNVPSKRFIVDLFNNFISWTVNDGKIRNFMTNQAGNKAAMFSVCGGGFRSDITYGSDELVINLYKGLFPSQYNMGSCVPLN